MLLAHSIAHTLSLSYTHTQARSPCGRKKRMNEAFFFLKRKKKKGGGVRVPHGSSLPRVPVSAQRSKVSVINSKLSSFRRAKAIKRDKVTEDHRPTPSSLTARSGCSFSPPSPVTPRGFSLPPPPCRSTHSLQSCSSPSLPPCVMAE